MLTIHNFCFFLLLTFTSFGYFTVRKKQSKNDKTSVLLLKILRKKFVRMTLKVIVKTNIWLTSFIFSVLEKGI